MRLTKLEIKGFKSFANSTVIHFNEDVIGVVGPNGSGKSNIVDAIRWVLGEQKSRELRLEKMSNVIFNGTKKRRPGSIAQVTLEFENTKGLLPTEYQTVSITRMLYRSGESEYRINGVPCRLKDIRTLFLDTGIGSNSYAIIALGMVDDILADKDNARRNMFEQAAGISKYKVRKKQTLNKLKNTEADLERVEDLLYEIENNLKSLEKQARRAKRYFNIKAEYKTFSVEFASRQLAQRREQYKSLTHQVEQTSHLLRELNVESREMEAALEKERKQHLDKEKALSEKQRQLNRFTAQIREQESKKQMLEQKVQYLQTNQQKLERQLSEGQREMEELKGKIDRYFQRATAEKKSEAVLREKLEEAEQALQEVRSDHSNVKDNLDGFLQKQQLAEKEVFGLEKERAITASQLENSDRELSQLEEASLSHKQTADTLDKELDILNRERTRQKAVVEKLEKEEEKRLRQLKRAEEALEETHQQLNQLNRKLDAYRNEHQLTKSMVDNLEGFPESIKFLSKHRQWSREAPLLSDLIYCPDEYRIAIEAYLDPYLNYYVVKTPLEAHQAIRLLGEAQKGKANFFVLDRFEDYSPQTSAIPGTQVAMEVVKTDPAYQKLVGYLLRGVLITESEEPFADLSEQGITLLAKSGRFVQRRFSISGGSVGLFEGKKIGRKKNLEMLEKSIRKKEEEERLLSTRHFSLKSKVEKLKGEPLQARIQQERRQLNDLDQRKVSVMTRLENAENFLREYRQKKKSLEERKQTLRKQAREFEQKLVEVQQKAANIKARAQSSDSDFREIAEALSNATADYNDINITFIRKQNTVQSLEQEVRFYENRLQEKQASEKEWRQTLVQEAEEQEDLRQQLETLGKQLLTAYEQRTQLEATLSETEQGYFKAREGIRTREEALRKKNRELQEVQQNLGQFKEQLADVKLGIAATGERLKVEFDISIQELMQREEQLEMEDSVLEEKVDRLKHRLQNYGEINPMAVEAYEEIKERYDSIQGQREDILEAKGSLEETIREIEQTATEQFMQAFEEVRKYFKQVFRSLFTDSDDSDLILLDPDDPLESKIEITAKPKGKRPQSISQLSGGEKTLTATALLFALYLLKPAPFCIFDEVDAPLDDANIEKFNRIVKEFSKDSQFVIVTHNKATMAAVDVIYGVYMQEQGVSSVSAVDFRALEHSSLLETV